ncbi:Dual specificity protein phosphatase 19 [Echinococcus granulosus]|uniref:Dual specificity protein phosphatase 19 n=1 Tax=Echinococcus granulosus TaxID=6210 RepID=A0A068WJ04_ECHGR|nr:Dual specificity protein phosphatase 19 [Echinococcus granulosus]CDS17663.1 dual specificity protein phosphatase 19 [Echinococcus granulosus]
MKHRLLRSTTVQVRTPDGRVLVTDRNGSVISTITRSGHLSDDISRYGFIVNNEPDLGVGEVLVQGTTYYFGSQDVAEDFNTLQDKGITHIVNLISNYAENKFEDQFEYLSCTLYDDMQADLMPIITSCCFFIRERVLPSHGRLLIHCNVGVSRAPSVLIGCLIKLYQMPFDIAYRTVNDARSISPNLNFKMQLRALSEEIVPTRIKK